MYLAAYSPWASPHLIIVAIALWPAATGAIIWVGMRMYLRSQVYDLQPDELPHILGASEGERKHPPLLPAVSQ